MNANVNMQRSYNFKYINYRGLSSAQLPRSLRCWIMSGNKTLVTNVQCPLCASLQVRSSGKYIVKEARWSGANRVLSTV